MKVNISGFSRYSPLKAMLATLCLMSEIEAIQQAFTVQTVLVSFESLFSNCVWVTREGVINKQNPIITLGV